MSKIITADFSSGKDRVTARGLWQFDRGVKLKVIGINVADVNRVDFASVIASDSVPVVVVPDGDGTFTVSIPGAVTKSSYGVTAYIYVDTADYGYTVKAVNMPVTLRQEAWKPGEEEKPDPFGEVVEKVSGYAKNARYFANAAAESEKAASESATTATQQATTAAQSATNASGSAESASQSAEAATTAAGNAAESATSASQSAETAGQKATAAETSASNAAESATAAEKSATAAGDSASAAKTSETAATASAVTATEQAEKIKASAEQIEKNKTDVASLKGDLGELEYKSLSNETKAVNVTSLFTLNGILNKEGRFFSNEGMLCTDFIKAKQGDVFYLYVAQDDNNSLPIAIYDMNKNFIKGVENKGASYILSYLEYAVEEDCLMRISSVTTNSLIYKKEHKNNSDVFDSIKSNFGELETYYEDMTQFVLDNGEDNKRIDNNGGIYDYDGGFISDYIKVEEGDIIKASSYVLYNNPVLILYYGTKKVNKVYGTEKGYQTVEVTIPPMVEYVRISSMKKSAGIEFGILKNKTIVEMLNEKTTIAYDIPNTHEEMVFENVTNGYIQEDGTILSIDTYKTTDYIDLDVYDWFHIVSDYAWNACGYVVFDKDKKVLSYIKDSVNTIKRFDIEPKKEYPNGKYIRFCGSSNILKVYKRKTSHSIGDCSEEAMNTGNVLYNKKIAFCGDSFTEASNLGKPDGYDEYWGCYKSYGWRIANRNKMKLYHDGISGSTMHIVDADNPNTRYPFAYQRYKNVPNDCDYIILQFGLNESSIANDDSTKGTKESTDATTMWGSWNTVLEYLITNHPTARIGVVMSDAWMPQTYFTTLKEICEWWGVPLLDLGGDPNVPVMNGGRRAGCGLTLNPKVAELRNATFYNAEGDAHPNDAGHEWRSTVIENFIRSL